SHCNLEYSTTSMTAEKSQEMVTTGPHPRSPAITTRRPGRSPTAANSEHTTTEAWSPESYHSNFKSPISMLLGRDTSGTMLQVTVLPSATTASLWQRCGASRRARNPVLPEKALRHRCAASANEPL